MIVNDTVRVLKYNEDHPNGLARVTQITDTGVYVANGNMPFMGTYNHQFFKFAEVALNNG